MSGVEVEHGDFGRRLISFLEHLDAARRNRETGFQCVQGVLVDEAGHHHGQASREPHVVVNADHERLAHGHGPALVRQIGLDRCRRCPCRVSMALSDLVEAQDDALGRGIERVLPLQVRGPVLHRQVVLLQRLDLVPVGLCSRLVFGLGVVDPPHLALDLAPCLPRAGVGPRLAACTGRSPHPGRRPRCSPAPGSASASTDLQTSSTVNGWP